MVVCTGFVDRLRGCHKAAAAGDDLITRPGRLLVVEAKEDNEEAPVKAAVDDVMMWVRNRLLYI